MEMTGYFATKSSYTFCKASLSSCPLPSLGFAWTKIEKFPSFLANLFSNPVLIQQTNTHKTAGKSLLLELQIILLQLVFPELGCGHIHADLHFAFVSSLIDGGNDKFETFLVGQNVGSKASFISHIDAVLSVPWQKRFLKNDSTKHKKSLNFSLMMTLRIWYTSAPIRRASENDEAPTGWQKQRSDYH